MTYHHQDHLVSATVYSYLAEHTILGTTHVCVQHAHVPLLGLTVTTGHYTVFSLALHLSSLVAALFIALSKLR
jgi:hypothetical protein